MIMVSPYAEFTVYNPRPWKEGEKDREDFRCFLEVTKYSGPPYPQGVHFKTSGRCLKPQMVTISKYIMVFSYTYKMGQK